MEKMELAESRMEKMAGSIELANRFCGAATRYMHTFNISLRKRVVIVIG